MAKTQQLHFQLLLQSLYSPDLAPSDLYMFADHKKCRQQRDLDRVIIETEAFIAAKDKQNYKSLEETRKEKHPD